MQNFRHEGHQKMAETAKRRGAGGKLARSETVTVRLDPKLRYLAELAARKQRRTLSSYIEWAIEDSLKSVVIHQGSGYNGDDNLSVADEIKALWDVDEAERFVKLAIRYPDLLTHQENEIWKLLQDSLLLSPAMFRRNGNTSWDTGALEDRVFPTVRQHWPSFMVAYAGTLADRNEWVASIKAKVSGGHIYPAPPKPKSGFEDMDDDIPF